MVEVLRAGRGSAASLAGRVSSVDAIEMPDTGLHPYRPHTGPTLRSAQQDELAYMFGPNTVVDRRGTDQTLPLDSAPTVANQGGGERRRRRIPLRWFDEIGEARRMRQMKKDIKEKLASQQRMIEQVKAYMRQKRREQHFLEMANIPELTAGEWNMDRLSSPGILMDRLPVRVLDPEKSIHQYAYSQGVRVSYGEIFNPDMKDLLVTDHVNIGEGGKVLSGKRLVPTVNTGNRFLDKVRAPFVPTFKWEKIPKGSTATLIRDDETHQIVGVGIITPPKRERRRPKH